VVIVGGVTVGLALACIPAGQFSCDNADQCSQAVGGICEPDRNCSYPDSGCDSGRRYSDFAGDRAGACVDPGADLATSTTSFGGEGTSSTSHVGSTGGEETSGGPLPSDCEGVTCSDAGACVLVEDVATCACDSGLYAVGLTCVEDPCAVASCFFVDADEGDDAAEGTRTAPWRTIARLESALDAAAAGDHYLLRRGRQWSEQLDIVGLQGELEAPIVFGAYGPTGEPRPRLFPGAVRVVDSEHVVVRDLEVRDDPAVMSPPNRPCVMVEDSTHVSIVGNALSDCINRGLRVHDGAAFLVLADNEIRNSAGEAVFLSDASWTDPPSLVAAHHWVIDNVIVDPGNDGIQVFLADVTSDVKVMGNSVAGTGDRGITVVADGYAWVGGNVAARAGAAAGTSGDAINVSVGGLVRVSGNVALDSRRGLQVGRDAVVTANTVVASASTLEAALVRDNADVQTWRDNLILAAPGGITVRDGVSGGAGPGVDFDAHWYGSGCSFQIGTGPAVDLATWQAALMSDGSSTCGDGSGVVSPAGRLDPSDWDAAFFEALTPPADWERCGAEAGAFDCDGARRDGQVVPIEDYFESDGFGWSGTLLVRQRYPAPG
jgi:hypothetical protein